MKNTATDSEKIFACDFETTVWDSDTIRKYGVQQKTEVWAYAIAPLYDKNDSVFIGNNIYDFMEFFLSMKKSVTLYFHNLKFDGSFIVDWLLHHNYKFHKINKDRREELAHKEFDCMISDMGQWYTITIVRGRSKITIKDSLKLLPASLRKIGKDLKTKHQKLEMEYKGMRKAYCNITEEEKEYIKNDVLVLKEALEMMFKEGNDKLTIGACCMKQYKKAISKERYEKLFPDLRECYLNYEDCGYSNAWEYIHKSYSGGWCYVNKIHQRTLVDTGCVYDANSHYPSQMSSDSGNYYPIKTPTYKKGSPTQELLSDKNKFLYIRVRCRFKIKDGAYPWIHIRNHNMYKGNENLETSDIRLKNGTYSRYYYEDGKLWDTRHEFIFTEVDYKLLHDTYDLYDYEEMDYLVFQASKGLFDDYIYPYYSEKQTAKGFKRFLCKLYLNNLYGKFAMSDDSSYKEPYLRDDNVVGFINHEEHKKQVGYIAIGSAITSYARNYTIRLAIANYDRFLYSDTDSVHLIGTEKPAMLKEHPTDICCWKQESIFDKAYYVRQKTYAEHIIVSDGEKLESPYNDIKASGMSKQAKEKFEELGYTIDQLDYGLMLPESNLKAKRIQGGILLKEMDFKIR